MRIILYSGKGGVGKTSVAAASAVGGSETGHKTLVLSTDSAHSLSDVFGTSLSSSPKKIAQNLYGQEVNVYDEVELHWSEIQNYISLFLKTQGFNDITASELTIFPGMDELASLLTIMDHYNADKYDLIIVDCAPTADTIRLLSFPDILEWYMKKLFHVEKNLMTLVRPVAQRLTSIPLPSEDVFISIEGTYERIREVKTILSDTMNTSIRLVVNPEKMVIEEARKIYTQLNLFDFSVDSIIVNKVIPEDMDAGYLSEWKTIQAEHIKKLHEYFSPLPILTSKLFETEMIGVEHLHTMASHIYGERDVAEVFYKDKPFNIVHENGNYTVSLKLPFLNKNDIDLFQKGEELIVDLGNTKRNIMLPRAFSKLEISAASFKGDLLTINFGGENVGE